MSKQIWNLAYRTVKAETDEIRNGYAKEVKIYRAEIEDNLIQLDKFQAENTQLGIGLNEATEERDDLKEQLAKAMGKIEVYEKNDPKKPVKTPATKPTKTQTKKMAEKKQEIDKNIPFPDVANSGDRGKEPRTNGNLRKKVKSVSDKVAIPGLFAKPWNNGKEIEITVSGNIWLGDRFATNSDLKDYISWMETQNEKMTATAGA